MYVLSNNHLFHYLQCNILLLTSVFEETESLHQYDCGDMYLLRGSCLDYSASCSTENLSDKLVWLSHFILNYLIDSPKGVVMELLPEPN